VSVRDSVAGPAVFAEGDSTASATSAWPARPVSAGGSSGSVVCGTVAADISSRPARENMRDRYEVRRSLSSISSRVVFQFGYLPAKGDRRAIAMACFASWIRPVSAISTARLLR